MLCLVRIVFSVLRTPLDVVLLGIFRSALPEFKALEEFEWIGYPELQADMVKVLLKSHPNLARLGLMYFLTTH